MNEWGIALVGFVGALLGGVVGFAGIRWQRQAEVWHDIRKNAAELYMKGVFVQRAFDDAANPARRFNTTPVDQTAAACRRMREIVAYLELVANVKTHQACRGFADASEGMQGVHVMLSEDMDAVYAPDWNYMTAEWIDARNNMLNAVRAKRLPRMPLRYKFKNYLALRRYERNNPLPPA
jgi:hypothetical protein